MEPSGTTTTQPIKRRSLDEYWAETKNIMGYLGFKYLTNDDNNIGQCVSVVMTCELSYDPKKGALSTWKFKHVLNECKQLLRYKNHKKRKILHKAVNLHGIVQSSDSMYNQDVSPDVVTDAKMIIDYIENTTFLTDFQKKCFINHYYLGMSHSDIGSELKISRARVGKILEKTLSLLKYKYGRDIDSIYG